MIKKKEWEKWIMINITEMKVRGFHTFYVMSGEYIYNLLYIQRNSWCDLDTKR